MNDRVSYNLNRAESLLDEPDTGFSLGGNFGGGGGIGSGIGSGIGRRETGGLGGQGSSSNFIAVRSNYTGSDMGDSDTLFSDEEMALSIFMMKAWAAFAKHG